MDSRARTVALHAKALGDTKKVFDALVAERVGFVKVNAPLWEKQDSGQWACVGCTCYLGADCPPKNRGKHPVGKGWEKHPTTDWAIASQWLKEGFNLGLYPMPGSRILGLDEDEDKALDRLFEAAGEEVPSFSTLADSMQTKMHVFLLIPDGFDIDDLPQGKFDGGDILRDGLVRHFVAPNMLHSAGRRAWNRVEAVQTASPRLLAALIASSEALKGRINDAQTPQDPGWEVKAGNRHDFLLSSAAKLRNLGLDEAGIFDPLMALNNLRCQPPKSEAEVRKIARDYAKKESTGNAPPITLTIGGSKNGHAPPPPGTYAVIAKYEPKRVDWMWPGWLPRAEPVILEGLGGEGKSTFVVDLMARLSRGDVMPDGTDNPFGRPMRSIYITGEDDPNRILAPRFMAARGDLDAILFRVTQFIVPRDIQELADYIASESDIGMVFIDPLFSHLDPKVNPNADVEIRSKVMDPLRQLARICDVNVMVARHLNKKGDSDVALRGSGSYGGLTGAARAVLHSMADPDDPERETKVIGVIKANYGKMVKPWRFRIESVTVQDSQGEDIETSRIVWLGQHDKFLDDIASAARSKSSGKAATTRYQDARDEADRDLMGILMNGELEARLAQEAMTRMGHSEKAIYGARARLRVEVIRPGGNAGPYVWRLPGQGPGRQGQFGLP